MEFDLLLLSRMQFAFTIGFHIIFPSLNIGLGAFVFYLEAKWMQTNNEIYWRLYDFWVKIFALSFGVGVVSGLVLSYELGANWSVYTEIGGRVLGPLISYEVLTAFFLEAGFLGIMLFGINKVGPKMHLFATGMVVLGTLASNFWILSANSWMQTPIGYEFINGKIFVESWWDVIFNPSFPYRLFHMMLASFITASVVISAISCWWLVKKIHYEYARKCLSVSMLVMLIILPIQMYIGDAHDRNTLAHQPMKIAAVEGIWETDKNIPLLLFAIPDQKAAKNLYEVAIPHLGSLILTHTFDGEVAGLKSVPPEDRPPVSVVFFAFRIMVGIGMLLFAISIIGLYLRFRRKLYDTPWFHKICVLMAPLPFLAIWAGWTVTEVGRQPFTIYGLLRTKDSVSPLAGSVVEISLILFILIYSFVFISYLVFLFRAIHKGPHEVNSKMPIPMYSIISAGTADKN